MNKKGKIVLILTFLIFCLISCASLRDVKLKENPEFELNSEKYVITSGPFSPISSMNKYIVEDQSKKVYELEIEMVDSETEVKILDEEEIKNGIKIKTQEFTSHKLFIYNSLNDKQYEVVGKTTYLRTKEEEKDESFETGTMLYPIEFWIFDEGNDVGKIAIDEPGISDKKAIRIKIETTINNKNLLLEYQDMFNKATLSYEDNGELIALISTKPKSFVTTKMKGEILLNQNLSEELKHDIITLYLVVQAALRKKQESGV